MTVLTQLETLFKTEVIGFQVERHVKRFKHESQDPSTRGSHLGIRMLALRLYTAL